MGLVYNFPSKLLSVPENFNQKEALRKIGTEIRQSVPEGMQRNASYNLGTKGVGQHTVKNRLGRIPTKMIKNEQPEAATYSVQNWTKDTITINVTEAGKVSFYVLGG